VKQKVFIVLELQIPVFLDSSARKLVGTDVFRVHQGVWLTCMRDCAPSYEWSAAITFE
jgi:hypothetical protein